MKIKEVRTDFYDIEELACVVLGLDYDEIDADTSIIEQKLDEEFFIDLSTFQSIVNRLLPLIQVGNSPLTEEKYKGFANTEKEMWLVKTKV